MSAANEFPDLINRVRRGDGDAAVELVRQYGPAIRRAARIRLTDPRLRRLFDSLDICQSVFASFFVRAVLGQYELESPDQLLHLLVGMARKKLTDHVRSEQAVKRDHRRVDQDDLPLALADRAAKPWQQAATAELIREFRRRLTPEEQYLADQRADGRGWPDLAKELKASPESLRKKLSRAVERITQDLQLEDGPHE